MFSYLDFRCYFEANGQNHINFRLIQGGGGGGGGGGGWKGSQRIAEHDIFSLKGGGSNKN